MINVCVESEIGRLRAVILHTPGREVERMAPASAIEELYSDIVDYGVMRSEYDIFSGLFQKMGVQTFEVEALLAEVLAKQAPRCELLRKLFPFDEKSAMWEALVSAPARELATTIMEGIAVPKDSVEGFMRGGYLVEPHFNFFFMRDASMSIFDKVLIGSMFSDVRNSETHIMDAIFTASDSVRAGVMHPLEYKPAWAQSRADRERDGSKAIRVEGGDVHVAREDILLVGMGQRTSLQGVAFLVDQLKARASQLGKTMHILTQELPTAPASFIHLDMVFTLLDVDRCMLYAPVILNNSKYRTTRISVQPTGAVQFADQDNLVKALNALGMPVEPMYCGGRGEQIFQDREQWHSGANFVCLAPGQVIGYGRHQRTIEELHAHGGFEVIRAEEVVSGKVTPPRDARCVFTIDSGELPRAGGGARCMTMPILRDSVAW